MMASSTAANPGSELTGENRFAVLIVAIAGAGLGLFPSALMLESWRLFGWFWAGSALIALILSNRGGGTREPAPRRTFLEFLLTAIGSAFGYQVMVGMAVVFGLAVQYGVRLINVVFGGLGPAWHLPAEGAGWWAGFALAVFFVLIWAFGASGEVREKLYTLRPDGQSAFHAVAVIAARRMWLMVLMHAAILVLLAVFFWRRNGGLGSGFGTLAYFYLLFLAAEVSRLGKRPAAEVMGVQAATRLFEALGCTVLRQPRTQDPAVDRLLSRLDLVASKDGRAWALTVQGASQDLRPIGWTAGAGHLSAVNAYTEKHPEFAGIEPVILLLGTSAEESLMSFASDEGLRLVRLEMDQAQEMMKSKDAEWLRNRAERLLLDDPSNVAALREGAAS